MIQYLQWTYVPPNVLHLCGTGFIYVDMAKWLAPFMPFTGETLGRQFTPIGEFPQRWITATPETY